MKRIALPAVLSLLGGMPAVLAQFNAPISGPLGVSDFLAGNILVGGSLVIVVMIFTIFIENYLKNKGYKEHLGGPKVPGSICAILIVVSMMGAYVPGIAETAGPIVGAVMFLVFFWYIGMVGMAFIGTPVGKAELLRETAAMAEAEAAAFEGRKGGIRGATDYVREAKTEIAVVHDLKKLQNELFDAGMVEEAKELEGEIKDQENGLELETIIFTMSQLEENIQRNDPLWTIIYKILPALIAEKIDKDHRDIDRIKNDRDEAVKMVEEFKKEGRVIKEGTAEHKKMKILEKAIALYNRILSEIIREEKLTEKELYLVKLTAKHEKKDIEAEVAAAKKQFERKE